MVKGRDKPKKNQKKTSVDAKTSPDAPNPGAKRKKKK